jgi:hypothetical protein
VIIAGVVVGLVTFIASSAIAAPDPWPAGGHRPSCDSVSIQPTSPVTMWYTDNTPPTISHFAAPPKLVVGPGLAPKITVSADLADPCSGIEAAVILYNENSPVPNKEGDWAPNNPNTFRAKLVYATTPLLPSQAPMVIKFQFMFVWDRYSSFVLGFDDKFVSSIPVLIPGDRAGVNTNMPVTYVVDASTLTATAAKTVKKAAMVKVSGVLKNWNGTKWIAHSAVPVSLQRRIGAGKWVTVGSLKTDASGKVAIAVKATKTAKYQLVFKADLSKGSDSATSKPLTVTVK